MAPNYVDTYDREKELSLMDKLAEHQVLITKRRRAMAAARALLAKAKRDERAIKSEIFINRMGQAEYQRRQNGAKMAGLAHTAAAAKRKALLATAQSIGLVALPDPLPSRAESVDALAKLQAPLIVDSVVEPAIKSQVATIEASLRSAEGKTTEGMDSSGFMDGDVRRCQNCKHAITRRGLCSCAGVRHREFRVITKGPTLNIKHAPVLPYQMEGKIDV